MERLQIFFFRSPHMTVLGMLSTVALLVGGVQTTMVLNENDRLAAEEGRAPVVEVQAVQADTTGPAALPGP